MSRILVYDCFSGISGDMHIGAMLDLGVPEDYLRRELARLGLGDEFLLEVSPGSKLGITGTRATVQLTAPGSRSHDHDHSQHRNRDHSHRHNHSHDHEHAHDNVHSHPHDQHHHRDNGGEQTSETLGSRGHRHLPQIRRIIEAAGYPAAVQARALDIFTRIAVAEAKVHGIAVDAVHFHEVGATDAIVDIVAAALCLEYLQIDQAYCATLELGGGMVRCAHGLMPVPAPATAEILAGVPCRYNGVNQEATTPTGAAILRHCVSGFRIPVGFNIERIGYGVGQKDFSIPNVLRVMLGDVVETAQHPDTDSDLVTIEGVETETNLQIECNIDDMSPEAYQPLLDRLFEQGANDVFFTPVIMKKSRPGVLLSVLSPEARFQDLLRVLFDHSSSIGVRAHKVVKHMLPRTQTSYRTSLGEVRVKVVRLPDGVSRFKVEHDDVMRIASATGRNYLQIHRQLETEVTRLRESAAHPPEADSRTDRSHGNDDSRTP
ncbi:MAG: nickel pincer cofactor biosynthesis protein LarC [Pseudomonadales bacterium]